MGTLEFKPIQLLNLSKPYFTTFTAFSLTKLPIKSTAETQKLGGGKRDRTADLLHAMQALSQLSYTPAYFKKLLLNLGS